MKSQLNSAVVVGNVSRLKAFKKIIINYCSALFIVSVALFSGEASAVVLRLANLSYSYSNCSYTSTSDTVATFKVTIAYKDASGYTGGKTFLSRGILLYAYDGNGVPQGSSLISTNMTLNGAPYSGAYSGDGYTMYYGVSKWVSPGPITADISFTVLKSKIASWPAVGVRAGNYTTWDDIAESTGLVSIGPSTTGGACKVFVDPELPPPAVNPIVTMSAPDWDLGVLPRGEETTLTLPATKDRLCFSYDGSTSLTNQKYLINATNTNGLSANGSYLLKSLEDSSQTVPYTLTLANSKDSVLLPNTQNRLFSLETGGKTCFTPTFKAQPDKAVKGGAYSDILTFTVVAKP